MAKDFLKKNNTPFQEMNVGIDQAAAKEMTDKSGQMGVPVLDIDGEIIVGFDKEAIIKALGI
jgi:glutaredoxin